MCVAVITTWITNEYSAYKASTTVITAAFKVPAGATCTRAQCPSCRLHSGSMHDAGDNSHAFMLEHSEDPQNERGSCITQSLGPLVPWSTHGSSIYTFYLCHPSHLTQKNASRPFDTMDQVDIGEASRLIHSAKNVLILLGAGLSQPSGIPTFQEPWEGIMPREVSSPSFFRANPVTSWRFFEDRRQKALRAVPNAGHHAVADFARRNVHAFTITQNIDGMLMNPL